MPEPTTWYHGGAARLRTGQLLLPPSVTGVPSTAVHPTLARYGAARWVYLTSSLPAARMYAAFTPLGWGGERGGDVYEVHPNPPVEADPDYLGDDGGSIRCAEAVILRVVERGVPRPDPAVVDEAARIFKRQAALPGVRR